MKGPLSHQIACYVSRATRKLLRCGRRWGKTRIALLMSIVGHGRQGNWKVTVGRDEGLRVMEWDGHEHRGVINGYDVYWIARDYKQAGIVWREEIQPNFKNLQPDVVVHEQDRRVDFKGLGSFIVRSAENINSVRGSGEKLGGVVIDEGAFLDLQEALQDVVLPALLDNEGWLVVMSTTNAGPDGYEDLEVGKRTPSYFNILCERVAEGLMGPEWEEFYGTPFDNPALSPAAIEALIAEYPSIDDVRCQQEVFAKLLVSGAGVAFPEWRDDLHVQRILPEDASVAHKYRWSGGGDWGYEKQGVLYLLAAGPDGLVVRWEYLFRKMKPFDVGYSFTKQSMRFPRSEFIAIDTPAVSDGGPTILEELQRGAKAAAGERAPVFINPPKGPGSRATKKMLLHEYLKWQADGEGKVHDWGRPKLVVHPDCEYLCRTLPRLPRDPKQVEDVDTNAEDHGYDGLTANLMARTPKPERKKPKRTHKDDREPLQHRMERRIDDDMDPLAAERMAHTGPEDFTW